MKIIIKALLLMSLILVSCKKEEKIKENETEEIVKEGPSFFVDLDLIIKKDDTLEVFYTEYDEETYNGAKNIKTPVIGSDAEQKLSFKLPSDVLPTKLRIDFGQNTNQEPIEIKKLKISYLDKIFEVNDTMFFQYFIPNEQIEWDRKKAIMNIIEKDKNKYDPQFGSRETMEMELEKMSK